MVLLTSFRPPRATASTMPESQIGDAEKHVSETKKNSCHQIFVTDVNVIGDVYYSRHQ